MALVLLSKSINDIKILLTHIITVALNKTEGVDVNNKDTPCETSKKHLISLIGGLVPQTLETLQDLDEIEREEEQHVQVIRNKKRTKHESNIFYTMVQAIVTDVERGNKIGNRGNQQYLPDLVKCILGISSLIPLWTSVMVPIFGYGGVTASSAPVETEFKILKHQIFKNKTLPMRVDDFIFHHIPSLEGAMKTAAADRSKLSFEIFSEVYTSDSDEDFKDIDFFEQEPNLHDTVEPESMASRIKESKEVEDWRGETTTKHRKHSSYLQKNPDLTLTDLKKTRSPTSLGILKNGNRFLLQPVNVVGERVVLSNTCAFDSLFHLFAAAYSDSESLKDTNLAPNAFFSMIKDTLTTGISRKTYTQRASILIPLDTSPSYLPQGLRMLSCETAISPLASSILKNTPSVIETSSCGSLDCPIKEKITNRVPFSVALHHRQELTALNNVIAKDFEVKKSKCLLKKSDGTYCQGLRTLQKKMTEYLLIEPIELDNQQKLLQCILKLRNIPNKLNFENQGFCLRGCVGYLGTDSTTEIGHYVTYSLRNDGLWETYNDLKEKKEDYAPQHDIRCHLILYSL